MANTTNTREQITEHALPGWFEWVQDHFFLSALILAEAYLLGDLMQRGWVTDIEAPDSWGRYHGVGVVLFFAAGAMAAGVALACSVKASAAFGRGKWGRGLFNFVGVLMFSTCEVWASLSERSAHLVPTPADQTVLTLFGWTGAPISPTVVIVAALLPFTTLYYGFSRQQLPTSLDEEREALERELTLEPLRQQVRARKAVGAAQLGRSFVAAVRGQDVPTDPPPTGPGSPVVAPDASKRPSPPAERRAPNRPLVLEYPPEWRTIRNKKSARTASAQARVYRVLNADPAISTRSLAKRAHVSDSTASKYARLWRQEHADAAPVAQMAQ